MNDAEQVQQSIDRLRSNIETLANGGLHDERHREDFATMDEGEQERARLRFIIGAAAFLIALLEKEIGGQTPSEILLEVAETMAISELNTLLRLALDAQAQAERN
jgi:hypothetical protein